MKNTSNSNIRCRYRFTRRRLLLSALLMAGFIIAVIWPAFELCRKLLADDPAAFSLERGLAASAIATAFFFYAYWQMSHLTNTTSKTDSRRSE